MSFTDFGLKNFRGRTRSRPSSSASTTTSGSPQSKLQIPNFEFLRLVLFNLFWAFSNVVVHVIIGVAVAVAPEHQGPEVQGLLPGDLHPPGRHPADHRGDGLAEHVRPGPRARSTTVLAGDRRPASASRRRPAFNLDWLRQADDPIPFIPLAARVLRDAHRQHLAGLAAQRGRRDRRAPEHPGRALRGRRDGRRQRAGRSSGT